MVSVGCMSCSVFGGCECEISVMCLLCGVCYVSVMLLWIGAENTCLLCICYLTRQNMLCICYVLYVMYMLKDDVCCLSVKHDHFCKLDVRYVCNYVMYLLYWFSDTRSAIISAVVCSISVM